MYNELVNAIFLDNLIVHAEFRSGEVKEYDFKLLFEKYPIFMRLANEKGLFEKGYVTCGGSGIIWDDDLDIAAEAIYDEGKLIEVKEIDKISVVIGNVVSKAREEKGLSQVELAKITKIHQADISKIERGIGNPSVKTLDRIAKGLGLTLKLSIE